MSSFVTNIDVSDIPMPSAEALANEASGESAPNEVQVQNSNEPPSDEAPGYKGLSRDEARELGLINDQASDPIEKLLDGDETPEATVTTTPAAQPTAKPETQTQLSPTDQMLLLVAEQLKASQEQNRVLMERLAPKAETAKPIDVFADLPEEFNTPELRKFGEYLLKKAEGPVLAKEKALEDRILAAKNERQINQYSTEADSGAKATLATGFDLQGQDLQEVTDFLRDNLLVISHVHGKTPAEINSHVGKVFNKAVDARIRYLNSQAKTKVAARGHVNPAAKPQTNAQSGIPQTGQRPSLAEARAAGYRDLFDAGLDFDRKILEMRARQSRG